jgi:hypothetical protein
MAFDEKFSVLLALVKKLNFILVGLCQTFVNYTLVKPHYQLCCCRKE